MTTFNNKILVVDDERVALRNLTHILQKEGYEVLATQSGVNALKLLEEHAVEVVLTDLRIEKVDGMQILTRCRALYPDTEVIFITGYATLESAVTAMRQGAFYYLAKPFRLEEVRQVVKEAFAKVHLKQENRALKTQVEHYLEQTRFITQDPALLKLLDTARHIAPTDCTVLISGESGTGKELLARYIHAHSHRARGPFVGLNCGAFQEELLANELFGHEKGAFTGALSSKAGLIETANQGTLFLDEVTEMLPTMQVKLLRVLQEKEVLRLGATRTIPIDVRFVAATNRNVQEAISQGQFRQDLYFRLKVIELRLPPLAARRGDIPLLSFYFLNKYAELMKKPVSDFAKEALTLLQQYDFPGNIRELENLIARGVALASGETIEVAQLPEDLQESQIAIFRRDDLGKILSLEEQEATYVQWVLQKVQGNKTQAAHLLGVDRISLWRKLKKLGLN
jgi:DNA-binding NtrC family response regulator